MTIMQDIVKQTFGEKYHTKQFFKKSLTKICFYFTSFFYSFSTVMLISRHKLKFLQQF